MATSPSPPSNHLLLGVFCMLLGFYPIAIAAKWLPFDQNAVHAPLWIIFLSGVVFVIAGIMLLLRQHAQLNNLLAALLLASMAAVGGWITFFAPSDGFSGGVPFLSEVQNTALARGFFGLGTLLTAMLCGGVVA